MRGVAPTERDLAIDVRNETVIGDRNTVGVCAEIPEHLIRSAKRWFAVNHPTQTVKLTDQTAKKSGLSQTPEQAVEPELSGSVSMLERCEEFTAKQFAESPFR